MSKLHTEKRIKGVDTTVAENNASNFEDGDVVYASDGAGGFKVKSGPVGGGSFNPLPAGDLGGLGDVDLAGLSAADIGDQLTYSYLDATKTVTWRTGTTITIAMNKADKRGVDGNVVAITFVVDAGTPAGAASYSAAGNGTLQITYSDNVTTATEIKTAIDGVSDFTATITGTASHTANNGDGGLGNTTFSGGFTGWMSDSPGTGVAPTNLTYDAGTRTIASSTGVDAVLPNATAGGDSGLMTGADKTKLNNIETAADVTDATNVTAAGALMDSECASLTDVKALDQSVVSGADPTFGTANMTDATNKRFATDAQIASLVPMGAGNSYAQGLVLAGNGTHGNEFLRKDGTWQVVSSDFTGLTDTPASYAGSSADANKFVKVNGSGDGIVFQNVTIPSGNQIIDWTVSQTGDIHTDNYTNTEYTVGNGGLTTNDFTNTLKSKLDAIEDNATADQTASEIRTLVESATNSNVFTDADHTKLNGIEDNATADQTAAEIRTLVESASDSNVFTDADHTKLNGIAANAQVNVATNLTYTSGTRTLNSSTGANVQIPNVNAGGNSGLMTGADKTKLNGIATGAEVNVATNLGWTASTKTVSSSTGTNAVLTDATTSNSGLMSASDKTKLNGVASGAEVNVQADWNQSNSGNDAYIQNKPTLLATSGTPADNQIAVWTNSTTLEGEDAFSWNGSDKELTIGYDATNSHSFKRTSTALQTRHNVPILKYLMFKKDHSTHHSTGRVSLSGAIASGTLTNAKSLMFMSTPIKAFHLRGVSAGSHRYYILDKTGSPGDYINIDVSDAVSSGDSTKQIYFQLITEEFDNSTSDDLYIRWYDSSGGTSVPGNLNLNATVYKQNGTSWTSVASNTNQAFTRFAPVSTDASVGASLSNDEVNWIRIELSGTNLPDLHRISIENNGSPSNVTGTENVYIANFHVQGESTDTSFTSHEDGFITLDRDISTPTAMGESTALLYTNRQTLYAKTSTEEGPISIGFHDFSWCGGFYSTTNAVTYLPVVGTTELSTYGEQHQKIMMRAGQFRKIILRTNADSAGSTAVRFYKNGTQTQNVTGSWILTNTTGDLDYGYKLELDFSAQFEVGDVIRIGIDSVSNLPGDIIYATEFVYTSS